MLAIVFVSDHSIMIFVLRLLRQLLKFCFLSGQRVSIFNNILKKLLLCFYKMLVVCNNFFQLNYDLHLNILTIWVYMYCVTRVITLHGCLATESIIILCRISSIG